MMIYLKTANFRGTFISFLLSFGILNLTYVIASLLKALLPTSRIVSFAAYPLGFLASFEIILSILRYISYGKVVFTFTDLSLIVISSLAVISISVYANMKLKLEKHKKEAEMERLKRIALEERLRSIRMKLSDHFLFNTLNAVSEILREDPQRAEEILISLSSLYRRMLKVPEVWSLKEELSFIEDYMRILSIRFRKGLEFELEAEDGSENIVVPSLSLQPIVENAIFHGISKIGGGRVSIKVSVNGRMNRIEIENTGVLKEPIFPGEGLRIVEERFKSIYRFFEISHRVESSSTIFTIVFGGEVDEVRGCRG